MSAYKLRILDEFEKTGNILFMKNGIVTAYTTDIFNRFCLGVELEIKKDDPFHDQLF